MTNVLTTLKAKRADIAAQVSSAEAKLTKLRVALANLDAAMDILTPGNPDHIPARHAPKRRGYFNRNEFARLVREALRDAPKPLTASEVAAHAIAAKGLPPSAHAHVTDMAKYALAGLVRDGSAVKTGKARGAKWAANHVDVGA
jgi:hypothetical protein